MALSSTAQPAHDTIRGVRFAMLDGTVLVQVLVDHAALQDAERLAPESGDFLVRFSKQRDKFERIASRKHGRGQIEEDGSIVVHRSDLA